MTGSDRIIGVLIILLSTCCEGIGQLSFKRAANQQSPETNAPARGPFASALANFRWVLFGWFGFILDGLLWSAALYYLDVTVAHPIGSVVFVVVAIFSKLILKEHVTPRRWAGIICILCGAAIVAVN